MSASGPQPIDKGAGAGAADLLVCALSGQRFALPLSAVEVIGPAVPLAKLPHAPCGLLGVANLSGRIAPVVDPGRSLGRARGAYDGSGNIVTLRGRGGIVGIWVDGVERLTRVTAPERPEDAGARPIAALVEIEDALAAALTVPALGPLQPGHLAEAAHPADLPDAAPATEPVLAVEAAGRTVGLHRPAVLELIETLPWAAIPRAPAWFAGVGLLRGVALPVLSLAVLLGPAEREPPGAFVAATMGGRRVLLGVTRLLGLRETGSDRPLDLDALLSEPLRATLAAFPDTENAAPAPALPAVDLAPYLAFTVAGQDCAVPVACVERVLGALPLLSLPRRPSGPCGKGGIDGAIELHGRLVPVAALRARLSAAGAGAEAWQPNAYVVIRDDAGVGAIGVDRIGQVLRLRADDIAEPPSESAGLFSGVAARPDGTVLRIVATDRLWGGG